MKVQVNDMNDFFIVLTEIEDQRQFTKVKYPLNEVVWLVLMATLGNTNEWTEYRSILQITSICVKPTPLGVGYKPY
ncbi:hypothetical protein AN641_01235 [Candidatus Epulonipiscioides gigas]|nr:hypothetical protein AN641_01235 [Epulopiscium sp. SCG-C07WGA-EpuloA2]